LLHKNSVFHLLVISADIRSADNFEYPFHRVTAVCFWGVSFSVWIEFDFFTIGIDSSGILNSFEYIPRISPDIECHLFNWLTWECCHHFVEYPAGFDHTRPNCKAGWSMMTVYDHWKTFKTVLDCMLNTRPKFVKLTCMIFMAEGKWIKTEKNVIMSWKTSNIAIVYLLNLFRSYIERIHGIMVPSERLLHSNAESGISGQLSWGIIVVHNDRDFRFLFDSKEKNRPLFSVPIRLCIRVLFSGQIQWLAINQSDIYVWNSWRVVPFIFSQFWRELLLSIFSRACAYISLEAAERICFVR
jgi:hypothetical protein